MNGGEARREVLGREMTVLEHFNTWPEAVLKRLNSSWEEVLGQVF